MYRETNQLYFSAIPVIVYIVARLYFGVAYLIFKKLTPPSISKYGIAVMIYLVYHYLMFFFFY